MALIVSRRVDNLSIISLTRFFRSFFPSEKKWRSRDSNPSTSSRRPSYLSVLYDTDSYGLCQIVPQILAPSLGKKLEKNFMIFFKVRFGLIFFFFFFFKKPIPEYKVVH